MKIRIQLFLLSLIFTFVICQEDEVKKEIKAKFNFLTEKENGVHDQMPKLGVYLENLGFFRVCLYVGKNQMCYLCGWLFLYHPQQGLKAIN